MHLGGGAQWNLSLVALKFSYPKLWHMGHRGMGQRQQEHLMAYILVWLTYIPSMLFAILNVSSPLSNRVSSKSREPEILRDKKTQKFFRALKPTISLMKINPTMTSSCILALHLIYVQILVRKFILLLDAVNCWIQRGIRLNKKSNK